MDKFGLSLKISFFFIPKLQLDFSIDAELPLMELIHFKLINLLYKLIYTQYFFFSRVPFVALNC